MKKKQKIIIGVTIAVVVIAVIALIIFLQKTPRSLTAEFYSDVNLESFYYEATVTEGEVTYNYKQAAKTQMVTTIQDYEDNSKDAYEIFNGSYIFRLDFEKETYDTELHTDGVNPNGIQLLFARYDFKSFNKPVTAQEEYFDGKLYFCETFETADEEGKSTGQNKYYFQDEVLKVIVWVENGKATKVMHINTYTNELPQDICFQPPANFKAGQFIKTDVFDYSELVDGEKKK